MILFWKSPGGSNKYSKTSHKALRNPSSSLREVHSKWKWSCSVMSHCLRPYGLYPTSLLCPWGFSRQEYWSGLPFPSPRDLLDPGIEPRSPTLQADALPFEPAGNDKCPFPFQLQRRYLHDLLLYLSLDHLFLLSFVKPFWVLEMKDFILPSVRMHFMCTS